MCLFTELQEACDTRSTDGSGPITEYSGKQTDHVREQEEEVLGMSKRRVWVALPDKLAVQFQTRP